MALLIHPMSAPRFCRLSQFPSDREGRQAGARRSPLRRPAASRKRWWLVSHRATDWAWKTPARGVAQHVLLALADRANAKTDQCTPSLGELHEQTGLGVSTIRRTLRALETAGLLKIDVTHGGRRQRSTYTLLLAQTFQKPARSGRVSETETRSEGPGIEEETRPQRAGNEAKTRPLRATNPPGAGGVVLRTKTRTREPGTTGDAAASPQRDTEGQLFDAPPSPVEESRGRIKLAQAITNRYVELVPLSRFPAVLGIVRKAVDAGRYSGEDINAAMERIAREGRPLTVDTLRVELEGFAPRRLRPAAGGHVADPANGVFWEQ